MKSEKMQYRIARITTFTFTIAIAINFIWSCANKKQLATGSDEEATLLSQYDALTDSVNSSWKIMIDDDDEKHMLLKRLLLEVSYTNNYDKDRFEDLNDLVDELKGMRYDLQSMSNSSMIDAYDSATFDLSDQIIVFAKEHPRYDNFPLMAELVSEINSKNDYILMHRIHFDRSVKELNSFKKSKEKKLLKSDPEIELKSYYLFELPS